MRKGKSRGFVDPRSHENRRFAIFRRTSVETNERETRFHAVANKMQLGCEPWVDRQEGDGSREKNVNVMETHISPLFPVPHRAMISIYFWSQVLRQSGTHDWPILRHARIRKTVILQRVLIKRLVVPDRIMIWNRSVRSSIYIPRSIKIAAKKCVTTPRTAFPRDSYGG